MTSLAGMGDKERRREGVMLPGPWLTHGAVLWAMNLYGGFVSKVVRRKRRVLSAWGLRLPQQDDDVRKFRHCALQFNGGGSLSVQRLPVSQGRRAMSRRREQAASRQSMGLSVGDKGVTMVDQDQGRRGSCRASTTANTLGRLPNSNNNNVWAVERGFTRSGRPVRQETTEDK